MKQFLIMLLIAFAGYVVLSITDALTGWRRWRQLTRFAASHGYTLDQRDTSNSAPFFQNLSSWHLLRRFEIRQVSNILRGKIEDIDFVYFEQSLTATTGSVAFGGRSGSGKLGAYCQSIVALEIPESTHFEFDPESHKNLQVRRIGKWMYFLPIKPAGVWLFSSPREHIVLPVRKLEEFLAETSSIFKAGLEKAGRITVS
ncbi:MAG TPA: hypothetical protein VKV30_02190 [Candidatus Angelobacter sp.]|nr:hypothetical protein [Candidatus Angelobacter sp.]